jgi:CRP/FNR family transcriptional regulator, cyclic AMP receptor protein
MPFRGALGLSHGNHAKVPVHAPGGFPVKKPCRSTAGTAFVFVKKLELEYPEPQFQPARFDPLYLFYCGRKWKAGENASGWDLVQAMRSQDRGARALAAELLAETENGRLLVRDLRRTRSGLNEIVSGREKMDIEEVGKGKDMNTPYGLQIVENCMTCPLRKDGWFCQLSPDLLRSFSASSHLTTYPGGAILFVEGQMPRGAFVLCSGKVKLSTTSREGKVLALKMVEPGEVIGLSALISAEAYEVTAETVGPCLVNFVEREGLLRLMGRSGELGLRSAQAVSREFQYAYREFHELVLARSSSGKLARLLLSWVNGHDGEANRELRVPAPVTHEEMAQRIGASRETVTRLLSELKKKDLIKLDGSTLVIKNRTALEIMAV